MPRPGNGRASAIADAASSSSTSSSTAPTTQAGASFTATAVQADQGRGDHGGPGRGGAGETPLTGATKAGVESAVLARYPGASIVRTETNGDSAAPYESHITTSAGTALEVLVGTDFAVVDARQHQAHP